MSVVEEARATTTWTSIRQHEIGASVFRVVGGSAILYQYLVNYAQRRYLYGPKSVYPFDVFASKPALLSVYSWSASTWFFETVYHIGMLVALLWLFGWKTRWTTPLQWLLWRSLTLRYPLLGDGGDNLMMIVLVYACFADVGRYFALGDRKIAAPRSRWDGVQVELHNGAMLAFAIQIALLYLVAGLSKVPGESWQNGTAIYYALRSPEFYWPGASEWIYSNAYLVNVLTHGTVIFQIAFPLLIFGHRTTRRCAVVCALGLHLGIGLFMGLGTFAAFMIAADLAIVRDEDYRSLARSFHRMAERVTDKITGPARVASR